MLKNSFSSINLLTLLTHSYRFFRHFRSLEKSTTNKMPNAMTNIMPRFRTRLGESSTGDSKISKSCDVSLLGYPFSKMHSSQVCSSSRLSKSETKSITSSFGRNSISARFFRAFMNFLPLFGQLNCQDSMKTANCSKLIVFHKYLSPCDMISYQMKVVQENALTVSSIASSNCCISRALSSVS